MNLREKNDGLRLPGQLAPALAAALMVSAAFPLMAAESFLTPRRAISAPVGYGGLCQTYDWVCSRSAASVVSGKSAFKLAKTVNLSVNRATPQVSDRAQYRKDEVWALPTARGGDCEDLALLKKMRLVRAGVPASALLMATVLDLRGKSHAVLVFRTDRGDVVLDSLTDRIRHWTKTGYTFL